MALLSCKQPLLPPHSVTGVLLLAFPYPMQVQHSLFPGLVLHLWRKISISVWPTRCLTLLTTADVFLIRNSTIQYRQAKQCGKLLAVSQWNWQLFDLICIPELFLNIALQIRK